MSDDLEVLAEFVIWRLRHRDLPPEVAAAADRLAPQFPRRDLFGGYLEAEFSVSCSDPGEGPLPAAVQCFGRRDALDAADRLICHGWPYVLIQRMV